MKENGVKTLENGERMVENENDVILQFFVDEYKGKGKTPSVKQIMNKFDLSIKKFYQLYPKGKLQLHKLAGIPVDKKQFDQMSKLREVKKQKEAAKIKSWQEQDDQFHALKENVSVLSDSLEEAKAKTKLRDDMRTLAVEQASIFEGRKQIFSSPESLLQWYEAAMPEDRETSSLLTEFKAYYKDAPEKVLYNIMGDLESYESHRTAESISLLDYVKEKLVNVVDEWTTDQKQKIWQKKFADYWRSFECPECGLDYKFCKTDPLNGELFCECEATFIPLCPNCLEQEEDKIRLIYSQDSYHCPECTLTLRMPKLNKQEMEVVKERQRVIEARRLTVENEKQREIQREMERKNREERAWSKVEETWNFKLAKVEEEATKKREEYLVYYKQIEELNKLFDALNIPFEKQMVFLASKRFSWPEPYKTQCQFTREEMLTITLLKVPFYTTRFS